MFAIIEVGGKQAVVEPGKWFQTELLSGEVGSEVIFPALLVADGEDVKIGAPHVSDKSVRGKIMEHGRGKKISVVKYKRKVRYRRRVGHRQHFTKVMIEAIT